METATPDRVLAEKVDAQAHTDRDARWLETAVNALVAIFFYWQGGSLLVFLWVALRLPVHLAGQWVSQRYMADPERAHRSEHWSRLFALSSGLDSSLWGLAAWFLPHTNDPIPYGLLVILVCVASSAAVYGTQLWSVVLGWVLPMNIGLLSALVWQGEPVFLFMAACVAINLGIVLHFGRLQQQLMTRTLMSRVEKEDLAEQLARQVRIAQQANEEKTRFLAAASHDLRQPMHAITLFGAVLEKELAGHPQHTNAQRLMHAADALSGSLGTMLDISRLDAGDIAPTMSHVPLNSVFRSLSETFIPDAEQRGLQLHLRATPLWVRTDPELLRRLLSNLVENALKYTLDGGVLVVARARTNEAWVEVYDTGVGIDPAHQSAVFREFYQINNPGRDRARGLGMGLSIVQRLARLLGCKVELTSRPGRGTRFRVAVPLAHEPDISAEHGVQQAPNASSPVLNPLSQLLALPRHVMLIDDEDDIADAMRAAMKTHGILLTRITCAEQAASAFDVARAGGLPIDALICDLRLEEGVDGLSLALALRQQHALPNGLLPTLIITGETAPEPLQRVRDSGLPVLFKPVALPALLDALAR